MNTSGSKDSMHRQWRGFNTMLTVLFISAPFLVLRIFGSSFVGPSLSEDDLLPVSIRATSQADYSQDSQTFTIPPINEDILNQLITNVPATYNAQDRMATLQANLSSPVPTMTNDAQARTPSPTLPPQTQMSTLTIPVTLASPTPTVSATPGVPASPTAVPENTARPTLAVPTMTAVPSSTKLPPPTNSPWVPGIPPVLPTILPNLPTLPLVVPTTLPNLPTLPPVIPTIPPVLPTLLASLPAQPPILPTLPAPFP